MTEISSPCIPIGLAPSFGFGDRIGLATPGHVAAMKRAGRGIQPIFPQQSIREMARTGRSAERVMEEAVAGMKAGGWSGQTGADADHLKTVADVDVATAAGFTLFTIDPSDHVDDRSNSYDEASLREQANTLRPEVDWIDDYLGRSISLTTGTRIEFDGQSCLRCAVKYGRALNAAIELARYIEKTQTTAGRPYEIELSIDETEQPTTLAEHYIIADQCLQREIKLVSLAPRFVGDFEKGVDYKGDLAVFERSLSEHAAIADMLGPYKLSLHSGSDKLSIYESFARATGGRFHVKTAGTSYLEALRVVAHENEELFHRIIDFAREKYQTDKATYHVSATLAAAPAPAEVGTARELEQHYLECWSDVPHGRGFRAAGRQILHCTFGSVLTDEQLGPAIRSELVEHQLTYDDVLAEHFSRHLMALRAGM